MVARVNRVLVIDDDEEDFLIIRDLLMDTGNSEYVLEWTSEVDAGRAALRARKHDAYLLDYRLGPADGMTMLREATLAGGPCPIIMLTGHGSDSVDQAALEAGASDFLVKGTITGEQLLRSLRYAIERDRQMNEVLSAHRRYRALFEKNPLPSWVQRVEDGHMIAVNDAMVDKYGYTRDELLAMSSQALVADETFSAWLCKRTPAGRWGEVQELGGAAIFLASAASSFVSGHILYVDGGITASL